MSRIPFIGKRKTLNEITEYISNLVFSSFKPTLIVVHHTGIPNLSQRPSGFTEQHILNLLSYYENTMGWSGAPHFFVDDKGIILFQELNKKGVHAKSFNSNGIGIEMLGNYDTGDFTSSRAKTILKTTHELCAQLCTDLDLIPKKCLRFHRDDPKTNKSCPGKFIDKEEFIKAVEHIYYSNKEGTTKENTFALTINGIEKEWNKTLILNGRTIVPARDFIEFVGGKGIGKLGDNIVWFKGILPLKATAADIDDNGSAWVYLTDVCNTMGIKYTRKS